ncbi:oocyte zinc finger protein XlCOF8.4-like [Anomaloglossus baeobatrachus]|uniref:oocyte zinc finger protein XlCOF8.4-like n=1 Tax=Anomaloglossus baeobatrachus TaxID=238106 RepID=UPI003F4F7A19
MFFFTNDPPTMDKHRNHMAADILDLTLEIIYLITGEDYTVVKKSSGERMTPHMSQGGCKTESDITEMPLPSLIHEQKILELNNKINELLTGEVPLRYQDVTVYFSMEEWEYLEGHKDLYKDVMTNDQQFVTSLLKTRPSMIKEERTDESSVENPPETFAYPIYSDDFPEKLQIVQVDQKSFGDTTSGLENLISLKNEDWMKDSQGNLFLTPLYELEYYRSMINKKGLGILKIFPCPECGKRFKKKSHLTMHEKTHGTEKPFACSECGKCFRQKSSLVEHRKKHTGERPVSCPECGKSFFRKSQLVGHQRMHTGEKPFSCLECGKSFKSKGYLISHQRIHTGEKPFTCSECGKCYNHKSSLMEHLTTHTGEKPFACSECEKCFNRKSSLVDHLRVHTGEKPYSCKVCGKCFSQKSGLIVHRKTHIQVKPI